MERIIILDFGSQVTQLIGRRLRELNVFCEIYPYDKIPALDGSVKGVILSGSPFSVRDKKAPHPDLSAIRGHFPLLGICYGAQYLAYSGGGEVDASLAREYGRAMLRVVEKDCPLLKGVSERSQVWMSHGDSISRLPQGRGHSLDRRCGECRVPHRRREHLRGAVPPGSLPHGGRLAYARQFRFLHLRLPG